MVGDSGLGSLHSSSMPSTLAVGQGISRISHALPLQPCLHEHERDVVVSTRVKPKAATLKLWVTSLQVPRVLPPHSSLKAFDVGHGILLLQSLPSNGESQRHFPVASSHNPLPAHALLSFFGQTFALGLLHAGGRSPGGQMHFPTLPTRIQPPEPLHSLPFEPDGQLILISHFSPLKP